MISLRSFSGYPTSFVLRKISNFMYGEQKIHDYMIMYDVASDQPLFYVKNTILKWIIQNNVQLTFKRIFTSLLILDS